MSDKKNIVLTNGQIELMLYNPAFSESMKKQFPFKTTYWLGRILDKIKQLAKPFQERVDEVVNNYAEKALDKDGNEKPRRKPDGQVVWGNNEKTAFRSLKELREIEVDLGIHKIDLDLDELDNYYKELPAEGRKLIPTPDDLAMLMPFFKEA